MLRKVTYLTIALVLVLSFGASLLMAADYKAQPFFDGTTDVLSTYVDNGRVDYAALKASGALNPLVTAIATNDPDALPAGERKAYLINAYNLLVLHQAAAAYPLKSVLDDPQFFDRKSILVGGRSLSLNQLEKDIIFKAFPDARIHFALVCGAVDCPPLTSFAYAPDKLDVQLERQTRAAINDIRFLRVEGNQVQLSQIFEWYASDFGGATSNVVEWINRYRDDVLPQGVEIGYYPYDWKLND